MKANSAAIPQACAHTHTCTYMGHHKIDSTRPVIMILYFRLPVPSVLAVARTLQALAAGGEMCASVWLSRGTITIETTGKSPAKSSQLT